MLWRTSFGLRLRSCGENPQAAETLGVNVYLYKYIAVVVSGGLAGIGGGFLALVSSSGFNTGQTGGRGYIGLAAMIFGNWRPGGLLVGALTFGYTDSLRLRNADAVHALLLLLAIGLLAFAAYRTVRGSWRTAIGVGAIGVLLLVWYLSTETVPRDFTSMTPYVTTLFVLALGAQRLRMPAADGQPVSTRGGGMTGPRHRLGVSHPLCDARCWSGRMRHTRTSRWARPDSSTTGGWCSAATWRTPRTASALCAECGLVSALHGTGGGRLVAMICVNRDGETLMPCGRCRQLLWENGGAEMQLATPSGVKTMAEVLPDAFSADDLS